MYTSWNMAALETLQSLKNMFFSFPQLPHGTVLRERYKLTPLHPPSLQNRAMLPTQSVLRLRKQVLSGLLGPYMAKCGSYL